MLGATQQLTLSVPSRFAPAPGWLCRQAHSPAVRLPPSPLSDARCWPFPEAPSTGPAARPAVVSTHWQLTLG